jgi:DNA-binding HxlR family transcriptional regulator
VLGKKWSILIVGTLGNHGRLRFNDLMRKLGGVSPKSLTERLRELEREGLVARISLSGRPPRVEYRLTAEGRTMLPMMRWALRRDHRRAPSEA